MLISVEYLYQQNIDIKRNMVYFPEWDSYIIFEINLGGKTLYQMHSLVVDQEKRANEIVKSYLIHWLDRQFNQTFSLE